MKKCPYCGYELNDDALICEHCYAGLPNEKEKPKEKSEHEERATRRKIRS